MIVLHRLRIRPGHWGTTSRLVRTPGGQRILVHHGHQLCVGGHAEGCSVWHDVVMQVVSGVSHQVAHRIPVLHWLVSVAPSALCMGARLLGAATLQNPATNALIKHAYARSPSNIAHAVKSAALY